MISTIRQKSENPGGIPMRRCIFGGTMIEYENMCFSRCRCISLTIFFSRRVRHKVFLKSLCVLVFLNVNFFFRTIKNTISCIFSNPPFIIMPKFSLSFWEKKRETVWSKYFLKAPRLSSWYFKIWCLSWIARQLFRVSFIAKYWCVPVAFWELKNRYFFAMLTFLRISPSVLDNYWDSQGVRSKIFLIFRSQPGWVFDN